MPIVLKLEIEELLRDPEAKQEFLEWAMGNQDFLGSFVTLLSTGSTDLGSWPSNLDSLREAFHRAAGDEYLANALRRSVDAEARALDYVHRLSEAELRLTRAAEILPRVLVKIPKPAAMS